MNSIKINTNKISELEGRGIVGIVLVPTEKGQFEMYVAWENAGTVLREGRASIVKATSQISKKNMAETLKNVCDYGDDVTNDKTAQSLFSHFINKPKQK